MSMVRPPHPLRLLAAIGVFLALSLVLTGFVVISVLDLETTAGREFHARLNNASGLRSGDKVSIAGLQVGRVIEVELADDEQVDVTFSLGEEHDIYDDTMVGVRYANLVGTRYLALVPSAPAERTRSSSVGTPLAAGATIPASRSIAAVDLTAVFDGFQPLFDALDPGEINQLTASIIAIFQGQAGTVASLVEQVGTVTTNLADRKEVISTVITNLADLMESINQQGESLDQMIGDFSRVVDNLAGQRELLAETITGLARFSQDAAELTRQAAPDITASIAGVTRATKTLTKNQKAINDLLRDTPRTIDGLNQISDSGGFFKVYLCNLDLRATGKLNISLVPGVPAPQDPKDVELPSGQVGDPARVGKVCQ